MHQGTYNVNIYVPGGEAYTIIQRNVPREQGRAYYT